MHYKIKTMIESISNQLFARLQCLIVLWTPEASGKLARPHCFYTGRCAPLNLIHVVADQK